VSTYRARIDDWDRKVVDDRFRALEGQCLSPVTAERVAAQGISISRSVDLRYAGQNYEIAVPFGDGDRPALRAAFERRHRQLYGYATGEGVECVNLRVALRVATDWTPPAPPAAGHAARPGEQRAFFPETGEVTMARHDRAALAPAAVVAGPAMIEDEWSTVLVYPGQRAVADDHGNLVIEMGR